MNEQDEREAFRAWYSTHKVTGDVAEAAWMARAASTSANVARYTPPQFASPTDAQIIEVLKTIDGWAMEHGLCDSTFPKAVAKVRELFSANVAQGAEAVAEDISLVRELQKALFYWMPRIAGEDSPAGHKAAEHAYLLIGLDDNSTECYGDQARSSLGIVNRELERIGIACSDAGCPDEMEVADFIADLYARAQAAATVASTDDARDAFIRDVAAQKPEKPDHWSSCGQCGHNIERAQDLLDAAQSASGDTQ